MKIIVKNIDIFEINGDVLVLKYAQALYGLDRIIVEKISKVKTNIANELPNPNSVLLKDSEPIKNFKKILFVGVPSLPEFQYNEITDFIYRALLRIQKVSPKPKTIIFTLHGTGYGLDAKKAFQSELEGVKRFLGKNGAHSLFEEIIFVERNKKIFEQIKPILEKFIIENKVIFSSNLKGLSKECFELICNAINEKKAKSPSNKNFGLRVLLKALNEQDIENSVELDTKNVLNRIIQFEKRIKEMVIEPLDDLSFLFEELNPVFLDIQLYIQKIKGNGYQEIAWIIQFYTINYLRQVCKKKKITDSYFLKKKEEVMNQVRFNLLNYYGELLIPKNTFPWLIVDEIMNAKDLGKYWEKFEKINTASMLNAYP